MHRNAPRAYRFHLMHDCGLHRFWDRTKLSNYKKQPSDFFIQPDGLLKTPKICRGMRQILFFVCSLIVLYYPIFHKKSGCCTSLKTALQCDFAPIVSTCKKLRVIFNSRTGHHTRLLTNGLTKPFVSFYFLPDFGFGLYLVFIHTKNH